MTNKPEPNTRAGEALKPCPVPWCSQSEPPFVAKRSWGHAAKEMHYSIDCPSCGLETNDFPAEAEAIAAWGTRPLPQPSEDQPSPYTCKHGCERDAMMNQLAKLQAEYRKLLVDYLAAMEFSSKLQADGDKLAGALDAVVAIADAQQESPVGPINAGDLARKTTQAMGMQLLLLFPAIRQALAAKGDSRG